MEKTALIIQASPRAILIAAITVIKEDLQNLEFNDVIVIDLKKNARKLQLEAYNRVFIIDPSDSISERDLDMLIVKNHARLSFYFSGSKMDKNNKHILKVLIGANLKSCSMESYTAGLDYVKSDACFRFELALVGLKNKAVINSISRRIKGALLAAKLKELSKEMVLKLLFMELISGQVNLEIEGLLEKQSQSNKAVKSCQSYLVEHPEIGTIKVIVPMNEVPIQSLYKEKNGHDGLAIALKNGRFELILSKKKKLEIKDSIPRQQKGCHFIVNEKFLFPEEQLLGT